MSSLAKTSSQSDSKIPEQSSDPSQLAVSVENITVNFRSYDQRPATLKESLIKGIKSGTFRHYSQFKALSDVSFKVPVGGVFGIVGSNGAGKSTLLRVISGVLPPSEGSVTVRGSLDSLIQLGAGFDSELNAIENLNTTHLECMPA